MKSSLGFGRSLGQPRSGLTGSSTTSVTSTHAIFSSARVIDLNGLQHSSNNNTNKYGFGPSIQTRNFAVRYSPGIRFTEFGIGRPMSVPKTYGRSKLPRRRGFRGRGDSLRDPKFRCNPQGIYDFMDFNTLVQAIRNCPSVVDRDRFPSPNELELYYKKAWKSVKYHGGPDYMAHILNLTPYRNFVLGKNEFPTWVEEENILKRIKYFQRRLDAGKAQSAIPAHLTQHLDGDEEEEEYEEEEGEPPMSQSESEGEPSSVRLSDQQASLTLRNQIGGVITDPASKILQSNHNPYRGLVKRELFDRNSVVRNIQGKRLTKVQKNRVIRKAFTNVGSQLKSMDDLVVTQKRDHFKRKTRWMRHLQNDEEKAHDETMYYNEKLEDAHPYRTKEDKRFMRFLSLSGTHILLEGDPLLGHIQQEHEVDRDLDLTTRRGRFRRWIRYKKRKTFFNWKARSEAKNIEPHQIKGERVR